MKMNNIVYDVRELDEYTIDEIDAFISDYKDLLVGGCIFSKNSSWISKIISFVQGFNKKETFVPSHVAPIIEIGDQLYIFDMKPPIAKFKSLRRYLLTSDDDFKIFLKNYKIDNNAFCDYILKHTNTPYPYLSAIGSIFSKKKSNGKHCSELMLRALQEQHCFKMYNAEITPLELYHLLLNNIENYNK